MALYFKDTEITNIDNLVPQIGLDITDIWFGDTNVYTVWQVYEGTLPATLNANGDAMRQYRIYGATDGATGGVGDKTVQLFDKNTVLDGYEIISDGMQENTNWCVSDFIPVESGTLYKSRNSGAAVLSYTDKSSQPTRLEGSINENGTRTLSETKFIRINCRKSQKVSCIVAKSNDLPENYVPFGYGVDISTEKPIIYGVCINPNDPNSYTAVTYLEDAVGKTPAAMGSTAFSYGDWANAFFMPRPCMLKYDGTVDYYLNPNDYSQKADGTPSDYNDLAYGGNAMMEFPLIWYKFVQGVESGEGYFYCSNRKVDDSYKCFSNLDCDGNIIEHFYMPIYNGCTYDGKMRSISGLQLSPWSTTAYSSSSTYAVGSKVNYNGRMWKCATAVEAAEAFDPAKWEQFAFNGQTSGAEEIIQATANNTTAKVEWYTDVLCDRQLINALLVLLGKSLDTQSVFGRGIDSGSQAAKEAYVTGSLDDKGLFYGSTANGDTAVKVFGIENWWACVWHRTAGLVGAANNTYLYKMTYSTADGSTADGYNTDGTGYLSVGNKPTTNDYIKKMQYGLWGCLPIETGSYSTQFFRDYWHNGTGYARFGGNAYYGAFDGAFYARLSGGVGNRYWDISSDLSCKPCRTGNLSKKLENATVTPIYIGNEPLGKDEYVDYQAGKVYRIKNLFDKNDSSELLPVYINNDGVIVATASTSLSVVIHCKADTTYKFWGFKPQSITFKIGETSSFPQVGDNTLNFSNRYTGLGHTIEYYTTDITGYMLIFLYNSGVETQHYTPEQYFENIVIQEVGDEYTTTDPPVTLPALPTCNGTTIVDYAGSGTVPEKAFLKYRKENF